MAKRKKKSYRRSSRRMSGVGSQLTSALGVIGGAAIGRVVSSRVLPNLNPQLKNAGVIAIGAFVMPRAIKGAFGESLGMGMVAAGGLGVLQGLGVIAGTDEVMAGDDLSVIAGDEGVMAGEPGIASDNLSVIAGLDEMDSF